VTPASTWYPNLGAFTFPTLFVRLFPDEVEALAAGRPDGPAAQAVIARLDRCTARLPGAVFVSGDVCAPTDSPSFAADPSVSSGAGAWRSLTGSAKVRAAFETGRSCRIALRPYRRMNRTREFRLFFHGRTLRAMSQYNLDRHYARLAGRQEALWQAGQEFAAAIAGLLPADNQVVDVYLCSDGRFLIVDLNAWGPPTDPLLLKTWDRDWGETAGLRLMPKPVRMTGDISVSF